MRQTNDVKKPHLVSFYGPGESDRHRLKTRSVSEGKPRVTNQESEQPESRRVDLMRKFSRATQFVMAAVAALMIFAVAPTPSQAATGTVRLHVVKVGVVLGGSGGEGVLYFHHRRYPLKVSGIGLGTVGIAAVDLVGTVSNLRRASDILGSYSDAGAGISFVGGQQA